VFDTPRCLIFNPQVIDNVDFEHSNWNTLEELPTFFSLQYWKSSKHVDDLIRAIPHYYKEIEDCLFMIGGSGMEYHYMNSEDKVKENYLVNLKLDPDISKKHYGRSILELAKECNLRLMGWMDASKRDKCFRKSSFFVDTAYYKVSEDLGEHFSRTLIESMMNGVVPIGRNLGLSNNEEGIGDIFKPDENYLMIPYDAKPKEFADYLLDFTTISEKKYDRIVRNNFKLLKYFDIDFVCRQYVDVIEGKDTGWYGKYEIGKADKAFRKKAEKIWYGNGQKRTFSFKR
jgi:glycosyltransferase involved in cell wall biosynthesis